MHSPNFDSFSLWSFECHDCWSMIPLVFFVLDLILAIMSLEFSDFFLISFLHFLTALFIYRVE